MCEREKKLSLIINQLLQLARKIVVNANYI